MPENIWEERCKVIIESSERQSTIEYARSVLQMIRLNGAVYPTSPQKTLIKRIWSHYERLNRSDVEKEILEMYGS